MENNAQILDEFLLEAQEIFDQLDTDLVRLEHAPQDQKLLASIFRAMHTIKGSSGFFAFQRLEKVAHGGESLLAKLRESALMLDQPKTNALLATLDCLRSIVQAIAQKRHEPAGDDSELLLRLSTLTDGRTWASEPAHEFDAEAVAELTDHASSNDPASTIATDLQLHDGGTSTELTVPVKISVESLDKLMDLVSEMVLARNRLLSFVSDSGDSNFSSTVRTIDLITLELQERMMKTRMQPISTVWAKFPRLVRDLAQDCGKKVQLVQIGAETELDRALLEGIRDPLVHIIRNSVDHGIEAPEQRLAQGKPEAGTITLRSKHENGMVVIEIVDDGAGINLGLVASTAVQRGLVTAERVARMADREIIDFIYLPGFSTKAAITKLSGRGVGMDVVRTNVQQIGGSVEVTSSAKGTELCLRIPLTLAIMPALFVQCATQRFAVPQNNLLEMIRLEQADTRLEDFYGVPVFRLRNTLIPVVHLGQELGLGPHSAENAEAIHVVVVQAAGLVFGLVVDKVLFMQEVVVKSAGPLLKNTPIYSGATILGDGQVAMIFDVGGIAVRSGLVSKLRDKDFQSSVAPSAKPPTSTQSMLLFDLVHLSRVAIALYYVDRLEMFPMNRVEQRGQQDVVIYGEQIMKLVWVSDFLEDAPTRHSQHQETINVIVHYHEGQPLGLVVSCIHDIVEIASEIVLILPPQKGLIGSAIHGNHVVSILDLEEILRLSTHSPHSTAAQGRSIGSHAAAQSESVLL